MASKLAEELRVQASLSSIKLKKYSSTVRPLASAQSPALQMHWPPEQDVGPDRTHRCTDQDTRVPRQRS